MQVHWLPVAFSAALAKERNQGRPDRANLLSSNVRCVSRGGSARLTAWSRQLRLMVDSCLPSANLGFLKEIYTTQSKDAPVEHQPALPYKRMPAFMAELSGRQGAAADALAFSILTGARPSETVGTTRSEINFTDGPHGGGT